MKLTGLEKALKEEQEIMNNPSLRAVSCSTRRTVKFGQIYLLGKTGRNTTATQFIDSNRNIEEMSHWKTI